MTQPVAENPLRERVFDPQFLDYIVHLSRNLCFTFSTHNCPNALLFQAETGLSLLLHYLRHYFSLVEYYYYLTTHPLGAGL